MVIENQRVLGMPSISLTDAKLAYNEAAGCRYDRNQ